MSRKEPSTQPRGTQKAIVGYKYTKEPVENYPNATVGYKYTTSPEQTDTIDEEKMWSQWRNDRPC